MKVIIIALLCMATFQQNILLSSSPSNTIITSPVGQTVAVENHHNTNNPNYISHSAQWLWKSGSSSWPDGDVAIFQAEFTADCQSFGTLIITADNIFSASLNGGAAMTGGNWKKVYQFLLTNIQCGTNTLTITVTNKDNFSPAAVIFAVVQDQIDCYACSSPFSFYNSQTCKCQCSNAFDCSEVNPLKAWQDYPTCGCMCKYPQECTYSRYFKRYCCYPGYIHDELTCECLRQCQYTYDCPEGKIWYTSSCSCGCPTRSVKCSFPYKWDEEHCACVQSWPNIFQKYAKP